MAERFLSLGKTGVDGTDGSSCIEVPYDTLIPDTHVNLFRFLSVDLNMIISKIERTIDETFQAAEGNNVAPDISSCVKDVLAIHPFMETGSNLASYFNNTVLAYIGESYGASKYVPQVIGSVCISPLPEKSVITSLLSRTERVPDGRDKYSLYSLELLQNAIRWLTAVVFDDTFDKARSFTVQEREMLYTSFCSYIFPEIPDFQTSGSLAVKVSDDGRLFQAMMDFDDAFREKVVNWTKDVFIEGENTCGDLELPQLSGSEGDTIRIVYRADNLPDLLNIEIKDMFLSHVRVRRCLKCGRYYVYREGDPEYCVIPDTATKDMSGTCRAGYLKGKTAGMYLKAYKTHNQRLNRGSYTHEQMEQWKREAKAAKEQAIVSAIPLNDFIEILKK